MKSTKKLYIIRNGMAMLLLFVALIGAACTAPAPTSEPTAAAPAQEATAEEPAAPAETAADSATETPAEEAALGAAVKLNLNTVTEDELLTTIPDFGNRMVREFFEYRPYISIQQFRREIGKYVDEAQVAEYEQYVYVPVNVNESDAATVMQIPELMRRRQRP
ncbi:MAG: hypothetical protein R3E79_24845 [Caldilineaceae bacterium]